MKKFVLVLLAMLTLSLTAMAKPVDSGTARKAASTFLKGVGGSTFTNLTDVTSQSPFKEFYIFSLNQGKGFILVSADDCVLPILGYSLSNTFVTEQIPAHVKDWMQMYDEQIAFYREHYGNQEFGGSPDVRKQWEGLLNGQMPDPPLLTSVNALVTTTWNQSPYYNDLCPYDNTYSTKTVTGCVATATAQVMKFWNHPTVGYGSHSYSHNTYGTQSADFGATNYDWTNMPTSLTSNSSATQINAVATLMYHIGVAVEMDYGPSATGGSGAATGAGGDLSQAAADNALLTYFKYKPTLHFELKENYTDAQWCTMLRNELDAGRPMVYKGRDYSGGHAFVCDGYDTQGQFHFNWGWGGSYDGFYTMGDLHPGTGGTGGNSTYTFNLSNGAIMGIEPITNWDTTASTSVSVSSSQSNNGSVTGSGSYSFGDTITLRANANSGCRLNQWSDGSVQNPRQLIARGGSINLSADIAPLSGDTLGYCFSGRQSSLGNGTGGSYWGIKMPGSVVTSGHKLTAVQFYVSDTGTYDVTIYTGSSSPSNALYTQSFAVSDEDCWTTLTLTTPVTIPADQNFWITLHDNGVAYPASFTSSCGNSDGALWGSSFSAIYPSWDITFMIRGIFAESTDTNVTTENTLTVNNGTATNGYVPIYGYYCDDYTQSTFIIPADSLTAMQYGTINKLTFYSSNANVTWGNAQFEVYLTETNATSVSGIANFSSMTQVMATGTLSIANNIMEVTLTSPYLYMGGNLMIAFNQTTSGSYVSCSWYGVTAIGASYGGYSDDLSQQNFLPKTTFTYTPGQAPSCFPVTGLTASHVTSNSAILNWTDTNNTGATYSIYRNDTLIATGFTGTTYTVTGLTVEYNNTLGVVANCSSTDASVASNVSVYTGYCSPDPTSVDGSGISSVAFGGMTNTTHPSSAGYANYSSMSGSVPAGSTATVDITYATGYDYGTIIWVDWNNNMTFDGNEVVAVGTSTDNSPTTLTLTFDIPFLQTPGNYRMRIVGADSYFDSYTGSIAAAANANPCATYQWGVAEDYTLTVTEPDCWPMGVVIGDENSTTTSYYTPVNNYYRYTLSETIIDEAEIGGAMPIIGIKYYFNYASAITKKTNCTIWLQPTTKTAFISTSDLELLDSTTAVMVYNGDLNCSQGWNTFTFDTPYMYSGTGNLMVIVDDNSYDYNSSSHVFRTSSCTAYKTLTWYSDSYNPDPTNATYSGSKTFYQYRTVMALVTCDTASCHTPLTAEATTVGASTATLTWTSSDAASYSVTLMSGTSVVSYSTTTDTTMSLTGLTPNSDYSVVIRALCSASDSSDAVTATFHTECDLLATLPYTYGFEGATTGSSSNAIFTAECWKRLNNCTGSYQYPYVSSSYCHAGTRSLYWYSYTSTTASYGNHQIAVLPGVGGNYAMSGLRLKFWSKVSTATYRPVFYVGVMTDPTDYTTFVPTDTIAVNTEGNTDYAEYTAYLTNYNGNGRYVAIAAQRPATSSWYAYMDDITLEELPSCVEVVSVDATNITTNSAVLTWVDNFNTNATYTVSNAQGVIASNITGNSYTVTGLNSGTQYTFSVTVNCSATESTQPVSVTFYTACETLTATNLPYSETFESYGSGSAYSISPCWTKGTNGSTAYPYPTSTVVTGTRSLYFYGYKPSSGTRIYSYAALPEVGATVDVSDLTLTFKARRYSSTSVTYRSIIYVGVMTDPTVASSFVAVDTINMTPLAASTIESYRVDLANYTGTGKYVAFYCPSVDTSTSYSYNYIYIDDVVLDFTPSCLPVTNLVASNVTSNSATLTWTDAENTNATYTVYNGSTAVATGITGTTYTVTGLSPLTDYTLGVVANCSATDASAMTTVAAQTACAPLTAASMPFVENFDNYTSSTTSATGVQVPCWTLAHMDVTMTDAQKPQIYYSSTASYNHSGNYTLRLYYNGIYAMREIDTNISALRMNFWVRQTATTYQLIVGVMSDLSDATTFVPVDTINNGSNTSTMVEHTVYFNNYSGNGRYIAFRNFCTTSGTNYSYNYIDDITVELIPSCMDVANLTASNITTNSVTLTWTDTENPGATYTVYNGIAAVASGITGTTYTVTGLTPNTEYTLGVVANCSATDASPIVNITVRTECDLMTTLPYTYGFEGIATGSNSNPVFGPECWHRVNNGTQYYPYISSTNHTGTRSAYWYSPTSTSATYGTYQAIVLPGVGGSYVMSNLRLKFWAKASSATYSPVFYVGVMTDPTDYSTFVPTDTIAVNTDGNTNWGEYNAYLTNYNGNGRYVAIAAQRPATTAWYAYTDDFTLEELPSCFEVSNLAAARTNNSITLSWADNMNSSATYTVSDAQGNTIASGITGTTYTITGLTANTSYTYNVTANCSATDSSMATSITVTTDCDPEAFPFYEDFSTNLSSNVCWRGATGVTAAQVFAGTPLTLTTPQWSYASSGTDGLAAGHYYKNVYGTNQKTWMLTPNIDLSNAATAQLEFDIALTDYNNAALPDANGDTNTSQAFMVIVSTDGGNTWSASNATIWQNASRTDTGEFSYAALASTTYQHKVIDLSQYLGQTVKIAFYTQSIWSGGDNDLHIDNIAVTGDTVTPECWPMPIVIGNESSTTTTYNYPVNNYYRYTLSETIIDEAEIGGAMPIMGIKYYFNYASAMTSKTNCTIWLQPTTKTVFSSSSDLELLDSTTAVMVYTGDLNCSQGWNTFTFDTPYQYNGTGNLMVIVDDNSYSYNSNSHLFRTASCTGNKTLYWYSDSNNPDPSNSSFSGSKGYAQNRVVMALITCDTTSCHTPLTAEATTVGANTATVAWTSSNAASYSVTLMSGTSVVSYNTTTDTTMALTGLTANSDYSVVIRALCSATDSSDAITTSFHTECDLLATLPYTYGFEGATTGSTSNAIFTAECWKRLNNCTGSYNYPYVTSSNYHAGTRSLYWYSGTSTTATYGNYQIAVLPGVGGNYDMSGLRLKFWSKVSTATYRPVFYVGVMTDPNDYTTFVPTDTIAVNTDGNTNYAEYTAYLTGYNGNGRYVAIAAQRPASSLWYAYIDDVTLEEAPSCINPTITDVTYAPYNNGDGDYQATVTWSATGTSYQIGLIESAQTSIINIWTNSHSFVISPEVASYVKIRAICGVGDTSEWSDSVRLYYGYCAPNPTSVDASGITNVTFGTGSEIVNNSQRPTTAPYYGDYRNLIGAIPAGTTANVDITYATGFDYGTIIWVDWNKNYAFDGDEVVYVGVAPATNPTTLNATFNIPTTQDTGLYRMRIAGADSYFDSYTGSIAAAVNANPCFTSSYAVAHDYSLHVTEAPACLSVTNLVASEVTDSSVTLMWTNANSTSATYTVYNGSTAVATGITDTTYTIYGLNPLTDYTFGITANCSATAASTMTTLTVRTLAAPILCDGEAPLTFANAESITGTTQYFPAYSYYNYSYSEVIVPSTQLSGLGEIKGMEFHVNTIATGSSYFNNCEVYLMNTMATSLTNGFIQDAANFQLVYSGDLNQTDTGWYLITFANTFQYDGVSNLLVAVRRNHGAYQTSGTFGAYTATESLARYIYQDNGAYTIGSITGGTATTTVPVYHFLGCEGEVPSCMPVTNLTASNVTFTSATLTWADTSNTGATYTVYDDTTVVASGITGTSYTVTGLTAETNHTLRVNANCSATASSILTSVNVYTGYCQPNPTSVDGSGITSVAFGGMTNDAARPSGAGYRNYSNMVGTVSAGTTATVDITYATGYDYGTIIWVDWNNNMTFDSNEVVYVGVAPNTNPTTLNASFTIPATQDTGNYRMRILGADSYFDSYTGSIAAAANADPCASYTWGVAEDYTLHVSEMPSCAPVTDVTMGHVSNTTAVVSWSASITDSASAYEVEVSTLTGGPVTAVTATGTTTTLTGLTSGTAYNVRVRTLCGANDSSDWSTPVAFTTNLCDDSLLCPITVVMNDVYGDGWNGGALVIYDSITNLAVATLSAEPGIIIEPDEPIGDEPEETNPTSDTVLVNLCRDRGYWVSYTSGEYDEEVSFIIFASNGDTILSVDSITNVGFQVAFTNTCSSDVNPDDECWPMPIVIGNENSTTTANGYPVNNYYKYTLTETIIDEAEIGGAMPIMGIKYYFNYASAMTDKTNCTIWMQPTTKTVFSSSDDLELLDATTAVMVYTGDLNCTEGWNEFTFTTPYQYSGTGNLMVIVDDNSNDYNTNNHVFRTSACTGYKSLQWYSDSYNPDPTSSSYSGTKAYQQYRVVMALVTCDTNTCHTPLEAVASTVGVNNATVTWTSSNATSYSVTLMNGSSVVSHNTTTDTTYSFTGLTPNSDYSVEIRALCSASDSSAAVTVTFHTECDLMTTLPYTYGFEGATVGGTTNPDFAAECWKRHNNGTTYFGYPYINSSNYHTGSRGLYWYNYNTVSTYGNYRVAVLPGIGGNYTMSGLRLTFWAKASNVSYRPVFHVGVMTDPTDISTLDTVYTVNVNTEGTTDWKEYYAYLTNYTGNGRYVAIASYPEGATWIAYVDDVTLEETPSCTEVSNLAVAGVTASSVTLTWTDALNTTGTTYTVSNAQGTTIASGITATSYTVTGLTANTDYTFNVVANCSATEASGAMSVNAHTECDLMTTLPYTYGFEGATTGSGSNAAFAAECWHRFTNSTSYPGYPYISSTSSYCHTGSRALYWYFGNSTTYGDYQVAVLPGVGGTYDMNRLHLKFWAKASNTSYHPVFYVGVMTDPTDISTFVYVDTINVEGTTYTEYESYTAAYTGTGRYVAIRANRPASTWIAYFDDVTLEEVSGCAFVTNLAIAGVTDNSVTLSWTDNMNNVATYTVSNASGIIASGITGTSYTVTGLTANTDYTFYVTANCSATETSDPVSINAHTECAMLTSLPFTYGFEDASTGGSSSTTFVDCWHRLNNAGTYFGWPYVGSTSSYCHTGARGLYWYLATTTGTYGDYECIVMPGVGSNYDMSDLQLKFWARATSATYHPVFYVGVMTNPSDINSFVYVDTINVEGTTYTEYTAYLNNYTGNGRYVAIRANRPTSIWYATMDDITLEEMPSCLPVTSVTTSNVTANSATLTWTDNFNTGATYTVSDATGVVATGITGNTYTVTGLNPGTQYTFYVKANCSATDSSETASVTFYTACVALTAADLPYSETFESYGNGSTYPIHPCWTKGTNNSTAYPYPTSTEVSGTRSLYFYGYKPSSSTSTSYYSYAALPQLDATLDASDLTLTFKARRYSSTSVTYRSIIYVGVMTNPTVVSSFVAVDTINMTPLAASTIETYTVDLANYAGTGKYVAFYCPAVDTSTSYSYNYIYIDDVMLYETPTCMPVTGLAISAVTSNSVTLTWADTANTNAIYTVYNGDSVVATGITGTSYTVTGLTPNSDYTFGVNANCTADDASPVMTVTAHTDCGAETMPFIEDFSNTLANSICWRGASNATAAQVFAGTALTLTAPSVWTYASSARDGLAAGHYYRNVFGTNQKSWMITPAIDLTTATSAQLSFDVALTDYNNAALPDANGDTNTSQAFMVIVSTDGGNTWSASNATVWQNGTGDYTYASLASTTYQNKVINLNQYLGQTIKIAFYAQSIWSGGDNDLHIDNIAVTEVPNCPAVTGLAVSGITANSVTLIWANDNASAYSVLRNDTLVASNITDTTYTVTGLTAETNYTFSVVANCSATEVSLPVSVNAFTGYCTPVPTSMDGSGITSVSFGGMTNTTHPTAAGYANYSSMIGSVPAGTTAMVDITYATGYDYGTIIWVDWNNSLTFDSNEVVYVGTSASTSPTTLTASFTIPATQDTGNYRMRIVGADSYFDSYTGSIAAAANANPCASYSWGVAEDYTLHVSEVPSCLTPTDLQLVYIGGSSNAAVLSWTSNANSWNLSLNGTVTYNITANPDTITGLDPNTTYTAMVQTNCGNDTSDWSLPVSITTPCAAITLPYAESFEATSATRTCWTLDYPAESNAITYDTLNNGNTALRFSSYSTANDYNQYAYSPVFNMPTTGNTLRVRVRYATYGNSDHLYFGYRLANDTAFTWTENYFTTTGQTDLQTLETLLPINVAQLAVHYYGNYAYYAWIDSVEAMPITCPTDTTVVTATACDSYLWNDNVYTLTGNYTAVLETAIGCDSIVTLNLTINNSDATTDTVTVCDSYVWNDSVYTASTIMVDTLTNVAGCDSVVTINLTINHSTSSSDTVSAFNNYVWNGNLYTQSGTYTYSTTNVAGCDSVATLVLTVTMLDTVTLTVNDTTMGSVRGAGVYTDGDTITLYAIANTGYHFVNWSDGDTNAIRTIVLTDNMNLTAYFAINQYTIALAVNDTLMGSVRGAGIYNYGDTAVLTAVANTGYHFVNWSDNDTHALRTVVVAADMNLTANFAVNQYTLTVTANDTTMGSVTGSGVYNYGATATLTATADSGFHFQSWNDGNVQNPRTVIVTGDASYTAIFVMDSVPPVPTYTVTLAVNDTLMGSVLGAGVYMSGSQIAVSAVANYGYHFTMWNDGDTNNPRTLTVTSDTTLTATFAVNQYTLTVTSDTTMGSVTGAGTYNYGATATLTATANTGYHFTMWSDGDTNATRTIVMTADMAFTAYFAVNQYTIALAVNDTTMGRVRGAGLYNYGDTATLTAVANYGYHFTMWSDNDTNAIRTVVVTGDMNLTANFAVNQYTVALAVNDTLMGSVRGAGVYNYGDTAVLTAVANYGYHFVNWSDNDTNALRTVVVTADMNLTANFAVNQYTLTVAANDSTMGSVTGAGVYNYGATATLTAVANNGYHFTMWNDGDTNATRTVVVIDDMTLTAYFAVNQYTIALAVNDSTMGTVRGAGVYNYGDTAMLIATANNGYHFVNWSDNDTNELRTVVVTDNMNLTANFAVNQYTLTVAANDTTMGSVTGAGLYNYGATATLTATADSGFHFQSWNDGNVENPRTVVVLNNASYTAIFVTDSVPPVQIDTVTLTVNDTLMGSVHGAGAYVNGSQITVTAVANYGYHFTMWNDGDTNNPRTLTVTSDTTLTALFAANQYTVALAVNDTTMGSVTGANVYTYGDTATLTAVANTGYHFTMWSDGDTNAIRTIVVTADIAFTAYFAINQYTVALAVNDSTMGSVRGAGVYNYGDTATLTAVAYTGYHFVNWSDNDTNAIRTIVVTADVTLTATFATDYVAPDSVTFIVNVNDSTMGTTVPAPGTYRFAVGDTASVQAVALTGHHFTNWTMTIGNNTQTLSVNPLTTVVNPMMANQTYTLTANFNADSVITRDSVTIVLTVNDTTRGTTTPAPGTYRFAVGDSVYAVATPNTGYRFLGWSIPGLNNMNTDNPIRMMIPAEAANLTIPVTANFVPMGDDYYSVVATPVTTDGEVNAGGTITGNGTYPAGSNVTLTAMADEGYRFVGWYSTSDSTFDMPISTEYSYSFVIMDNVSLLALFTPESNPTAVISIATADSTMGYVLLNNDTILRYIGQIGEEVTIEAIAYEGYRFVAWSDGDTNALRTIVLDMPVTSLTARFEVIAVGIDDAEEAEEIVIYTENDRITVRGAENRPVYVFDVVGRLVAKSAKAAAEETFRMTNTGIYMVKVGNAPARRVVVRR